VSANGQSGSRRTADAPIFLSMIKHTIPGFSLTFGISAFVLTAILLVPLGALIVQAFNGGWDHLWQVISAPRVVAAYRLSLSTALIAALVNGVLGALTAWVLARYSFPGKRLVDGIIDLPFALPTAVAGIALTSLYAPEGWIGELLAKVGIPAVYNRLGITIALIFVGFPFVVRTLQPVLLALPGDVEEAAATLGANRWQVITKVLFPSAFPALLAGVALAFGRGVGEYGSIVFISGNLPFKTEIAPLLVVSKLEQFDYSGAAAIGLVMVVFSLLFTGGIFALQGWATRRTGGN